MRGEVIRNPPLTKEPELGQYPGRVFTAGSLKKDTKSTEECREPGESISSFRPESFLSQLDLLRLEPSLELHDQDS